MFTISEYPRTPYDLNFSVLGIPVRVHPFFWLFALVFGASGAAHAHPAERATAILLSVLAIFLCVLVHELGHAVTATLFGHRPWITLQAFGGLASYPHRRSNPGENIAITAAGPGAGFAFAAAILAILAATDHEVQVDLGGAWGVYVTFARGPGHDNLWLVIHELVAFNVIWGILNLVPVLPLDGGQIARELFALATPANALRNALVLSMIAGASMAIYALQRLDDYYMTMLFGLMAFASYQTYAQLYGGRWR